jgi:hypothetical protein
MDRDQLRLECLRLALTKGYHNEALLTAVDHYFGVIMNTSGDVPPAPPAPTPDKAEATPSGGRSPRVDRANSAPASGR